MEPYWDDFHAGFVKSLALSSLQCGSYESPTCTLPMSHRICSYQQSCSQLGSQRQERRRPSACFGGVDWKSTNGRIDRSMNLLTWVWSHVDSCCSVAWSLASAFFMNITDRAFVCFQYGAGLCIAFQSREGSRPRAGTSVLFPFEGARPNTNVYRRRLTGASRIARQKARKPRLVAAELQKSEANKRAKSGSSSGSPLYYSVVLVAVGTGPCSAQQACLNSEHDARRATPSEHA
jgi:hypothetical protein